MKLHQVGLLLTCSHTHSQIWMEIILYYNEISQTTFRLINFWQTTQWRHTQVSLVCPPHPLAGLSSPKQTQSSSLIHHPADWTSPFTTWLSSTTIREKHYSNSHSPGLCKHARHASLNAIPTDGQWQLFGDGKGWGSTRILDIDSVHLSSQTEWWPQRFKSYRPIWKMFIIYL